MHRLGVGQDASKVSIGQLISPLMLLISGAWYTYWMIPFGFMWKKRINTKFAIIDVVVAGTHKVL